MPYSNPKQLLDAATALPAKIESMLPAGAPKISARLLEIDQKLFASAPGFPINLPDLPPLPNLPTVPSGLTRRVTNVTITPIIPPSSPSAPGRGGFLLE